MFLYMSPKITEFEVKNTEEHGFGTLVYMENASYFDKWLTIVSESRLERVTNEHNTW